MDLWIRSQNKKALINVRQLRISGPDIMCLNGELLGAYKTKERALEVLDEIQDLFITKEALTTEFTKDGLTIMNKQPSSVVYKMPEE